MSGFSGKTSPTAIGAEAVQPQASRGRGRHSPQPSLQLPFFSGPSVSVLSVEKVLFILQRRSKSLEVGFGHTRRTESGRSTLIKPIQQPGLNVHDGPGIVALMKVRGRLMWPRSQGAPCQRGRTDISSRNCYMRQERCERTSG